MPKSGCKHQHRGVPVMSFTLGTRVFAGQCLAARRWFSKRKSMQYETWDRSCRILQPQKFWERVCQKGSESDFRCQLLGSRWCPQLISHQRIKCRWRILVNECMLKYLRIDREDAQNCFSSYPTRSSCFFPTVFFWLKGSPAISNRPAPVSRSFVEWIRGFNAWGDDPELAIWTIADV